MKACGKQACCTHGHRWFCVTKPQSCEPLLRYYTNKPLAIQAILLHFTVRLSTAASLNTPTVLFYHRNLSSFSFSFFVFSLNFIISYTTYIFQTVQSNCYTIGLACCTSLPVFPNTPLYTLSIALPCLTERAAASHISIKFHYWNTSDHSTPYFLKYFHFYT